VAKKTPDEEPTGDLSIEGEAPKKSKKKLIIIMGISVLLLAVLGAGGFFGYKWWMGKKAAAGGDNATQQTAEAAHGEKKAEAGPGEKKAEGGHGEKGAAVEGGGELVSISPFLVNLADPQGRRYLKLALDVEVKDKLAADELNKNMSKIKDSLLLLLSSKTYEDLASIENKILLKKEIVERMTLVLGEQKVMRVYITEIVIQ